jgi:P27 family predicted phage terminase small subunit
LTIDGQIVFHKIVAHLQSVGTWSESYLELVASASATYQNYTRAQQEVNETGVTTLTQGGAIKKNPECDIAASCFRDFMAFTNKFGLNPLFAEKVPQIEEESEI